MFQEARTWLRGPGWTGSSQFKGKEISLGSKENNTQGGGRKALSSDRAEASEQRSKLRKASDSPSSNK